MAAPVAPVPVQSPLNHSHWSSHYRIGLGGTCLRDARQLRLAGVIVVMSSYPWSWLAFVALFLAVFVIDPRMLFIFLGTGVVQRRHGGMSLCGAESTDEAAV